MGAAQGWIVPHCTSDIPRIAIAAVQPCVRGHMVQFDLIADSPVMLHPLGSFTLDVAICCSVQQKSLLFGEVGTT